MSDKPVHPLRPTTKLIVELRPYGLQFAKSRRGSRRILSFSDLLVISELKSRGIIDPDETAERIGSLAGVAPASVAEIIQGLVIRGRARRRERPVPVRAVPHARIAVDSANLPDNVRFALKLPLSLRQCDDRFELIDHEGCLLVSLTAAELIALSRFTSPNSLISGLEEQRSILGEHAVAESRLRDMLSLLEAARLLFRANVDVVGGAEHFEQLSRSQANKLNFSRQHAEEEAREARRQRETGVCRPKVIPVAFDDCIPAALGLIFAYAKAYEGGRLDAFYDFRLGWVWDDERVAAYTASPAIYMCSNYLWSHEQSIRASETVKRLSPDSITIHGGPDTPKYEGDGKEYFAAFPHVDIIVRGEGEATAAEVLDKLRGVIGKEKPDLSVLAGVAGVTYRCGDEIVRNPDRARIMDLDTLPSPYLTGLFDVYKGVPRLHTTLETNRGCPYQCTFCDWGSATASKIRKFDLNRVFAELQWCSDAKVQSVSPADANFGVFSRDVEVAEKVAELKKTTGYPATFIASYAKNSTTYLQKIIKIMADAGILTQGVLSLQSMDAGTLSAIKRSNIKVEKYDALANEMRNSNLQLSIELMMGLPGATLESYIEDLQQCIDREVPARINQTTLLVNSPMNEPGYRAEHQIETNTAHGPGKKPILVSTRTYTRADMDVMQTLRQLFILFDNFGALRLCSRFVHQQTGMTEMEFYRKLSEGMDKPAMQEQWPVLSTLVLWGETLMGPVYSWALVIEELGRFLVQECGIADDSALDSILKAQHALLPAHGRAYPYSVELAHDVVAWHEQMLAAKAAGHRRDWHLKVPPLAKFGPGRLEVNDEGGAVADVLGGDIDLTATGVNWDMKSGIGRAGVKQTFNHVWEAEDLVQAG